MTDKIRKGTKVIFLWGKSLLKMVVFNGRIEDKPTQQAILREMKTKRKDDTAMRTDKNDGVRG